MENNMIEIKPFSECEYAPNILYKVVRNETLNYQNVKVGDLIRLPNIESNCIFCYWRQENSKNLYDAVFDNFRQAYKCMSELDWADKIFVEYDFDAVYKVLISNAQTKVAHRKQELNEAESELKYLTEKYESKLQETYNK